MTVSEQAPHRGDDKEPHFCRSICGFLSKTAPTVEQRDDIFKVVAHWKLALTAIRDNVAAPDSPIQQSARTTLDELERAAFSLRGLADYLKHHPESILRGRDSGPEPPC